MKLKDFLIVSFVLIISYGLIIKAFPLVLALFLAILLEPLVQFSTRLLKIKRPWGAAMVSLLLTLLFFFIITILVVFSAKEVLDLITYLLIAIENISQNIAATSQGYFLVLFQHLLDLFQNMAELTLDLALEIVTAIPTLIIELVVFFVAFYIFSFNLPLIKRNFFYFFDESSFEKIRLIYHELYKGVIGFIRGQIIISFCIFMIFSIGFFTLKIKFPLGLAFIVAIIDFLPLIGSGIIIVPIIIYHFLTHDTFLAFGLTFLYVIATLLRRIMEPKILSQSMGISFMATLISMYLCFKLIGLLGLILGPMIIVTYRALVKAGLINIHIKL